VLYLPFAAVGESGTDGRLTERPWPTVMCAQELVRLTVRLFDTQGRDVTNRRYTLNPGVYFLRGGEPDAIARVVIAR
jgi:hypothetical protein